MKRILTTAVITLALASPLLAQTPFALQAMGQNVEVGTARDTGRGGWGMADSDSLTPGTLNPAALADLRFIGLVFSGYGEQTKTTGHGTSRETYRTLVPNILLAIPIRRGVFSINAGFNIKRTMQWTTREEQSFTLFGEEYDAFERYRRDGSLYFVPLGMSWRPFGGLALGANLNFAQGSIQDEITQVADGFLANIQDQQSSLKGKCYTASILWDGWNFLRIGASYTTPYDLIVDTEVSLGGVTDRGRNNMTATMPPEYKAGIKIDLGNYWSFGGDGQYSPFSEMDGVEQWEPYLRDEWTASAGFERRWYRTKHGRSFAMPIRFGFRWHQWSHAVGGPPVNERVASVGTGFPFRNGLGAVDFSLSYAIIGDEAENGYQSKSWRLGVSITGLEPLVF